MASEPLAIVTGAAHRLGRAFADVLSRQGYAVLVHYWASEAEAQRTADELRGHGARVFLARADLTNPAAILEMFQQIDRIPHALRAMVNSAGVFRAARAPDLRVEDWNLTLNLNLRAPFLCAREAAARMQSGGLIVNVSDVGARKSWSRFPAYSASKAGVDSLTRVLARTYAPTIRVNAIAPGLILRSHETSESEWQRLLDRLPIPRVGTVDELAEAFEFLLENEYVTGQTLTVDGGYSLLG
jgi:pteridine reductase